jgi:N-acetylglutamate synthase-like GNAT family acetyltransferase
MISTASKISPWSGSIRVATREDIPAITSLISSLSLNDAGNSDNGFLRQRHSAEEYGIFIDEQLIKLAISQDTVAGFILAIPWNSHHLDFERQAVARVKWTEKSYADQDHRVYKDAIYIGEVGVGPKYMRSGIGRALYQDLRTSKPDVSLITTLIEKPVANKASASFHTALGFRRVGEFALDEFFGLSPYQSGVYLNLGNQRGE